MSDQDARFPEEPTPAETAEMAQQGEDSSTAANLVYIMYLVGTFIWPVMMIGLILAYINKSDAAAWLQEHYRFQIRTFWIGLLYSFLGGLFALLLVGWFILLFAFVWLVVRCLKGMKALNRQEPVHDAATWLW